MMSFDEQDLIDLGNEMYTGRLTDEVLEESSFEDGDTPSEYTDTSGDPLLTGEEGEHGDYCYGVNHDSYNRPNFQSAQVRRTALCRGRRFEMCVFAIPHESTPTTQAFSYAATREWVAACRAWVNSEVNWQVRVLPGWRSACRWRVSFFLLLSMTTPPPNPVVFSIPNGQAMKTYVDADEDALNEDLQSLYDTSTAVRVRCVRW